MEENINKNKHNNENFAEAPPRRVENIPPWI